MLREHFHIDSDSFGMDACSFLTIQFSKNAILPPVVIVHVALHLPSVYQSNVPSRIWAGCLLSTDY